MLNLKEIKNQQIAIKYIMEVIRISENMESREFIRPFLINRHLKNCEDMYVFAKFTKIENYINYYNSLMEF